MLFNSIDFAIFLPVVFTIYWIIGKERIKYQNLLILIASYTFYGWWNWRFLFLILFSTIVDYTIGRKLKMEVKEIRRKVLLWTSIFVNLGLLGFFKYYNFFLENFIVAFSFFGANIKANSLNIILPVGISFYTFQTLSYTIDVYNRKIEPTKDFITFSAFVTFFPQLVAGPIERATNLLPQFYNKRTFNYSKAIDGIRQILWGIFKKIVIADNCAEYANQIFNNSADYSGCILVLGAIFFTFQIYGDFSGYSDIAIGTSRIFGFNLTQNFAFPYFSRDVAEFWRRWHISLSTWFRDYLYIPLGGSRGGSLIKIRNTFIIFIVSGFWHGANWTFIIWGALNAVYFLPLLLTKNNRQHIEIVAKNRLFPTFKESFLISLTFVMTVFSWIFFRAENIDHALQFISAIFENPDSFLLKDVYWKYKTIIILISLFLIIEWFGREKEYAFQLIEKKKKITQWFAMYIIVVFIIIFMNTGQNEFIYFQF